LAAALGGVAVASILLSTPTGIKGAVGPGVVGLFALLVVGVCFSNLGLGSAILLFTAPLLVWVPELPLIRRLSPAVKGIIGIALVFVPLAVGLEWVREKLGEESHATPATPQPTTQDYLDFGK
jgi:hypothetical protein